MKVYLMIPLSNTNVLKKCKTAGCIWNPDNLFETPDPLPPCENPPPITELRGKVEGMSDPVKMKSSANSLGWKASATMAIGALVLFWI